MLKLYLNEGWVVLRQKGSHVIVGRGVERHHAQRIKERNGKKSVQVFTRSKAVKYHFKIRKEKTGYSANCLELSGCISQGETLEKLKRNTQEALNLFLDEPQSSKVVFPLPSKNVKGRGVMEVTVDPKVALAFLLRKYRLQRRLTQSEAAKLLGLKGLYSYQRLESSRTANPVFETMIRLKKTFPELKLDELLAA